MDNPIFSLLHEIKTSKLSNQELIQTTLDRINQLNPVINAIPILNENVLEEAKTMDEKRRNNEIIGVLQGLPVVLKDGMQTTDMITTAGNPKLKDYLATEDALIVQRIKLAGGLIIGKSNTPYMHLDIQTHNELFGTTNNPWDLHKTSGGSSGGTAAAIASGMLHLGIGSDLAGSLRIPSSFCGITSLRPTEGRIPSDGCIPPLPGNYVSKSEVVFGPMSSSIFGLDLLMQVLVRSSPNLEYPDYPWRETKATERSVMKLAIIDSIQGYPIDNRIKDKMFEITETIKQNNISITSDSPNLNYNDLQKAHMVFYDMFINSSRIEDLNNPPVDDKSHTTREYLAAIDIRDKNRMILDAFLQKFDALIIPVTSTLPFTHRKIMTPIEINNQEISYWKATILYATIFSVVGNPIVTLPVGLIDGMPIGVQIIGRRWYDEELISLCYTLEEIFGNLTPEMNKLSAHNNQ
ncbi:MAG: amidase [Candidatus Heimdallarchaeota archaeon]|nr:amidase [Candidatus Heimdallarchaeota archaeon]